MPGGFEEKHGDIYEERFTIVESGSRWVRTNAREDNSDREKVSSLVVIE